MYILRLKFKIFRILQLTTKNCFFPVLNCNSFWYYIVFRMYFMYLDSLRLSIFLQGFGRNVFWFVGVLQTSILIGWFCRCLADMWPVIAWLVERTRMNLVKWTKSAGLHRECRYEIFCKPTVLIFPCKKFMRLASSFNYIFLPKNLSWFLNLIKDFKHYN